MPGGVASGPVQYPGGPLPPGVGRGGPPPGGPGGPGGPPMMMGRGGPGMFSPLTIKEITFTKLRVIFAF